MPKNTGVSTKPPRLYSLEQHDEWIQQKRYMSLTSLTQTKEIVAANLVDDTPTDSKEIAA